MAFAQNKAIIEPILFELLAEYDNATISGAELNMAVYGDDSISQAELSLVKDSTKLTIIIPEYTVAKGQSNTVYVESSSLRPSDGMTIANGVLPQIAIELNEEQKIQLISAIDKAVQNREAESQARTRSRWQFWN